jgi:hypothetical protein
MKQKFLIIVALACCFLILTACPAPPKTISEQEQPSIKTTVPSVSKEGTVSPKPIKPSPKNTVLIVVFDKTGTTKEDQQSYKDFLSYLFKICHDANQYVEVYTLDQECNGVFMYQVPDKPIGYALPSEIVSEIDITVPDGTFPLSFWKTTMNKQVPINKHYKESAYAKILLLSDGECSDRNQTTEMKHYITEVMTREDVLSVAYYGIDGNQVEYVRGLFPEDISQKLVMASMDQQSEIEKWLKKGN